MSGRTLEVFCDDARYPAMTDAQLSECIATIRAFSQGQPVRLESESWFGNFRCLLPMCWKYKQDAEYWKSWQDPDKIKKLEAENADLLAIAQGQREELARWRHLGETIHVHWRDGRIQTNPDGVCMCGSEKRTGHEGHQFTDMVDYYVGKTFEDLEKLIGTKK